MPTDPTTPSPRAAALDHLVVVAATLAEGVAWCQRTLGVEPGPGGEHPLMGTHNRLLSVASPQFAGAYLEIIAIQPGADKSIASGSQRWFDMDSPALQQAVQRDGPQLVHWVARVPHLAQAHAELARLGLDPGSPLAASRATPRGLLQWAITIRPDGQRPMGGCLPTLIQWAEHHPTDHMPTSAVRLQALVLAHPQAPLLGQALDALSLNLSQSQSQSLDISMSMSQPIQPPAAAPAQPPIPTPTVAPQPSLHALLDTPKGTVLLRMPGF